jgi:hypothetical protein
MALMVCATAAQAADTDAERMAASRASVDSVRASLGRVLKQLEAARQERDVGKVNFINEKSVALKGLMRIAEQSDINLQEALLKHDASAAAHEEQKLAIASGKSAQLAAESDSYSGDAEIYTGDTKVEMSTDDEASNTQDDVDISALFPSVLTFSARPTAASPYQ